MDLATLTGQLRALAAEALPRIEAAPDLAALDELDVAYLGRKGGALTGLMRGIGQLPAEDRPRVGVVVNEVREAVERALDSARQRAAEAALGARLAAETVDVTTPGRPIRAGQPATRSRRRSAGSARSSASSGSSIYEGPEIESDVTNFQMLNIPPDHPARDLWDTLYVDIPGGLLRTHTSPGQIHVMRTERPPIRALLPGRCFRYEAVDASHGFGVLPGRGTDGGRGDDPGRPARPPRRVRPRDVRRRPGDPIPARLLPVHGAVRRVRRRCVVCGGGGCPACGRTGWMTILGAGHGPPGRARATAGSTPSDTRGSHSGWASSGSRCFATAIADVRMFLENDIRFLEQFR